MVGHYTVQVKPEGSRQLGKLRLAAPTQLAVYKGRSLITPAHTFTHRRIMLFKYLLLAATLANTSLAHPWMREAAEGGDRLQKKGGCPFGFDKLTKKDAVPADDHDHEHDKRILGLGETVGGLLQGTGDLLDGLLGSLASITNGEVRVPDADHPFQEPGPSDQRGPCPGLNTLANHGCEYQLRLQI